MFGSGFRSEFVPGFGSGCRCGLGFFPDKCGFFVIDGRGLLGVAGLCYGPAGIFSVECLFVTVDGCD
jgi:hypothetical protein